MLLPLAMLVIECNGKFFKALLDSIPQITNSLLLNIPLAITSTVLSIAFLLLLKKRFLIVMVLPLTIASPLIALSMIKIYQSTPIYGTLLLPFLGLLSRTLPFTTLILLFLVGFIPKNILEAVQIFQKSTLDGFFQIILPLLKRKSIVTFILTLAFSMGEVNILQLLAPPGFQTISMKTEVLMHYGNYSYVASLSLFTAIAILSLLIIAMKLVKK